MNQGDVGKSEEGRKGSLEGSREEGFLKLSKGGGELGEEGAKYALFSGMSGLSILITDLQHGTCCTMIS